jgi:hypothetical protein
MGTRLANAPVPRYYRIMDAVTDDFYASLPVFSDFTQVTDEARFAPLPDGWVVGVADIVQSTKAIAENR